MFKVQFEFPDKRLKIALATELEASVDRFDVLDDDGMYDSGVYDDFFSVFHDYLDCIKGFEIVKVDKGFNGDRVRFQTYRHFREGNEDYVALWLDETGLKMLLQME